jgi:hypothetical protein
MSRELAEEQLIRSYFLGDLAESEQERIQQRLFTDPEFFESLLIIEGELVDDYVLGLISDRDRTKLESGFLLSPPQYRKVRFVKALDLYISERELIGTSQSGFSKQPSRFVGSASHVIENRQSDAQKRESDLWERLLREAQANRALILSLILDDWLGFQLLITLNRIPGITESGFVSMLERDYPIVRTALSRLIECGLVEETKGKYSCSWFGAEILEKLKGIYAHP